MSTVSPSIERRNDLDALRGSAMLLGIALHASLSFFPSFWMVADSRQSSVFGILFSAIHGFRMPLFFVMSGFFSAMLLHKRGSAALVKHRFKRVFLPLLLGLFTIIPLTNWISSVAMTSSPSKSAGSQAEEKSNLWSAAETGDLAGIERHLAGGQNVYGLDPERRLTPLLWAALADRIEAVELLVQHGADVNFAAADGGTPLHAAAFVGNEKTVAALIKHGANVNALNKRSQTALDNANVDADTTRLFASILKLKVNEPGLAEHKTAIAAYLREHGAKPGKQTSLIDVLIEMPVFSHLWFLWFLWWLMLGYAAVSAILARLPRLRLPEWLVLSPARYLWLIPLTMIPQSFMASGGLSPIFGPDSSTGILPMPHLLAYYAIFFGFGALYYGYDDRAGLVSKHWQASLAIGFLVIFPMGLALIQGWSGPPNLKLGPNVVRYVSIFLQASYAWIMTFGLMGLFRRFCSVESPLIRYLSDSAYWLYLAHLPLIIGAQYLVRDWPIPALAKFVLMVVVVTLFLLWTYQFMVRYTWLGRFLNGPRTRPPRRDREMATAAGYEPAPQQG